jgi:hypothetical protein
VQENPLSPAAKIHILFKEYDTLRTEIIARINGGYQLIAVATLLFTAMLTAMTKGYIDRVFWVSMPAFVAAAVLFSWVTRREINTLAKYAGEASAEDRGPNQPTGRRR